MTAELRGLPIKAAYSITELSRASGIERRTLKRLLSRSGIEFLGSGRILFVSLSELERKVPVLWDGIKAAHSFGGQAQ